MRICLSLSMYPYPPIQYPSIPYPYTSCPSIPKLSILCPVIFNPYKFVMPSPYPYIPYPHFSTRNTLICISPIRISLPVKLLSVHPLSIYPTYHSLSVYPYPLIHYPPSPIHISYSSLLIRLSLSVYPLSIYPAHLRLHVYL